VDEKTAGSELDGLCVRVQQKKRVGTKLQNKEK
jgi:hypothetical protein